MTQIFRLVVRSVLVVAVLAALVGVEAPAQAQGEKITICHIPPGNPENAHLITISINALQTHLEQHGDQIGDCGGE